MRKTNFGDIFFSFIANGLNFGTGIILLPLILKSLPPEVVGLWYIFMGINGLILLLDAALSPSIARNAGYAWGGANKLEKQGFQVVNNTQYGDPNLVLLKKVHQAGKEIYKKASIISLFFLIFLGSAYIYYIFKESLSVQYILSWFIFVLGISINLKYGFWPPLLSGIGYVKEGQIAIIGSKIIQFILTLVGFYFIKSILVLAVAFLASGFVLRLISSYYFSKYAKVKNNQVEIEEKDVIEIKDVIFHNSKKILVWSLGNYAISNFGLFFIAAKFDLATSAQYAVTIQLFSILVALCTTMPYAYIPELNKLVITNQGQLIRRIIYRALIFSFISYIIGTVVICLYAQPVLVLLKSNVLLLDNYYIVIISIIILLEMIHSICSVYITTFNYVPFSKSAIISGCCVIGLTLINFVFLKNLWSVIIARGLVQLLYNNWIWPKRLYIMLNERFR